MSTAGTGFCSVAARTAGCVFVVVTCTSFQSTGNEPVSTDDWNMSVRMGATSSASSFKT